MNTKAVIFDLDGTLLDTLQDLCNSTNDALLQFGYQERTLEEVRMFVGNGVKLLMLRALGVERPEDCPQFDEVFAAFRRHTRFTATTAHAPIPVCCRCWQS